MAPADCVTVTATGYSESTTSTTDTTDTTDTCDYSYTYSTGIGYMTEEQEDERYNKILEIIRKQSILNMKSTWSKKDKQFKPMPIMKPEHRLQNICFNGRGWG
jgi:hypothetical protein